MRHVSGIVWTARSGDEWVWRCINCYTRGNLPPGLYEETETGALHFLAPHILTTERRCEGCNHLAFENRPAGHCWACLATISEAGWDFTQNITLQVLQIQVENGAVFHRLVHPELRPAYPDFFLVSIARSPDGNVIVLPEVPQENEDQLQIVMELIENDPGVISEDSGQGNDSESSDEL